MQKIILIGSLVLIMGTLKAQCVFHRLYGFQPGINDGFYNIHWHNSEFYAGHVINGWLSNDYLQGSYLVKMDSCGEANWKIARNRTSTNSLELFDLVHIKDHLYTVGHYFNDSSDATNGEIIKWQDSIALSVFPIDIGHVDWHLKVLTHRNDLIVVGLVHLNSLEISTPFLYRSDTLGQLKWVQIYDSTEYHSIYSLYATGDGGYIIGGEVVPPNNYDYSLFLLKTDSLGNEQWTRKYGGSLDDGKGYTIPSRFGGYITVGYTEIFDDELQGYILRTDNNGYKIWDTTFGDIGKFEVFLDVEELENGDLVIAGGTSDTTLSYYPVASLYKFDKAGNLKWERTYHYYPEYDNANTYIRSMIGLPNGGFAMAGFVINNLLPGLNDSWVLTVDSLGNTCGYPGCSGPPVPLNAPPPEKTTSGEWQLYPNPASGMLYLNPPMPHYRMVQVQLLTSLGQSVSKAVLKQDIFGMPFQFDLPADLSTGLYFLEISVIGKEKLALPVVIE